MQDCNVNSNFHTSIVSIEFRTKFEKQITSKELRYAFICAVSNFNLMLYKPAKDLLIKLKFASIPEREEALNSLGFTQNPDYVSDGFLLLNEEQVSLFQAELRYQYQLLHPDFLAVAENPDYSKELKALRDKVNDQVIYFTIVDVCQHAYKNKTEFDKIIDLLRSNSESRHRKGLQQMLFSWKMVKIIEQYTEQICDLFESMYKSVENQRDVATSNTGYTPFGGLAEMLQDKGFDLTEKCSDEVIHTEAIVSDETVHDEAPALNSKLDKLIFNKDILIKYLLANDSNKFELLKELLNCGLDLNYVIANEKEIFNFIQAYINLQNARVSLEKATVCFNEACKTLE